MKNKTILRRIKFAIMALILVFPILGYLPVHATGETKVSFGKVTGQIGDEVTVPVIITNNPGIAAFRFRISYDVEDLIFISVEKGSLLTSGMLSSVVDEENKTMTFLWVSPTNVSGDGELARVRFRISEQAQGNYPLTVIYHAEDFLNESREQVVYTVEEGMILTGSTLSGTITSFGETNEPVTLRLIENDNEIAAMESVNGNYRFDSVPAGTYKLMVSKKNHVTRTYELAVGQEDVEQNVKIHLIGDIDGDGRVRTFDYTRALAHVRGTSLLEGYEFQCADVNGDGRVRTFDYTKILAHVRGTEMLW